MMLHQRFLQQMEVPLANADSYTLTGEELRLALEAIRAHMAQLGSIEPSTKALSSRILRLNRLAGRISVRIGG